MQECFAEFEKKGWSEPSVAQNYAKDFATASAMCVPKMVERAGAGPGTAALDLCCGQGIVAAGLSRAGATVTAVDFSPAMLEIARSSVPGVAFHEGDVQNMPFADNAFDCATCGFGILHVPDAGAALVEAARVLKPGGRIAWTCWHGPEQLSVLPVFFGACMKHGDPSIKLPPSPPAFHYAQPENATPIMEQAGFGDIQFDTVAAQWSVDRPDAPFHFFSQGAVRAAGLMDRQPETNKDQIRRAVAGWVEDNCARDDAGNWIVPIPAVVVSGRLM